MTWGCCQDGDGCVNRGVWEIMMRMLCTHVKCACFIMGSGGVCRVCAYLLHA